MTNFQKGILIFLIVTTVVASLSRLYMGEASLLRSGMSLLALSYLIWCYAVDRWPFNFTLK